MPGQRYVTRELTHFIGRRLPSDEARYELLRKILRIGKLTPGTMGRSTTATYYADFTKPFSRNLAVVSNAVCFCDIPLADIDIHTSKYSRFGIAFLKSQLLRRGASPVFYVEQNSVVYPHESDSRGKEFDEFGKDYETLFNSDLNELVKKSGSKGSPAYLRYSRRRRVSMFLGFQVLCFIKFFDSSLPDDHPENFYMEREWRVLGTLKFDIGSVHRVLLPVEYASRFHSDFPSYHQQVTFIE